MLRSTFDEALHFNAGHNIDLPHTPEKSDNSNYSIDSSLQDLSPLISPVIDNADLSPHPYKCNSNTSLLSSDTQSNPDYTDEEQNSVDWGWCHQPISCEGQTRRYMYRCIYVECTSRPVICVTCYHKGIPTTCHARHKQLLKVISEPI